MKDFEFFIIVMIILLMSGCINKQIPSGKIIKTPKIVRETSQLPQVYFCPQDKCREHLMDLIKDAEESIHCAFFDIDLEDIINELKQKEVEVKLIMDKKNAEKIPGVEFVTNDDTNQLMHNKFCVIDGKRFFTGSFNPTERGNFYNNNNMIIIPSKYLSENYEQEFQELWNKNFGCGETVKHPIVYLNNKRIENYFCPEDSCSEHVIESLDKAKGSIYFMTFSFTDDYVGNALINKHEDGVDVKGILEKNRKSEWSEYDKLKENGIDVKWDNNKYVMHHKVFIIDNKTVITGSFNPTKSADEKNDENILIMDDERIAKEYLEEFERIWNFEDKLETEEREAKSIMISEVYYDTSGKDAEEEFIELYNPTGRDIDLDYYFISDNESEQRLNGIIKQNSTRIIKPKFYLKNKGGILILKKSFEQVDFVSWESLWNLEAKKGESIQRKCFDTVNSKNNWGVGKPSPRFV